MSERLRSHNLEPHPKPKGERLRRSAASTRRQSEKVKARWQQELDDAKAAGIRITGKRPTRAELVRARQKLARKRFAAIMPQLQESR